MTWVRVDSAAVSNPKIIRVSRLLKIDRAHAFGLIVGVWAFAMQYAADGNLASFEAGEVETWVGWTGAEGALVEALEAAGLIDRTERGPEIHDWSEFTQGLREAARKKRHRDKLRASADDVSRPGTDAGRTGDGRVSPTNGRTNERDERTNEGAPRSTGPTLPLKDDPAWLVPPEVISELEALFPHLSAAVELSKAAAWSEGNPGKRWTRRGARKALIDWFERAAERPANGSARAAKPPEPVLIRAPRGGA